MVVVAVVGVVVVAVGVVVVVLVEPGPLAQLYYLMSASLSSTVAAFDRFIFSDSARIVVATHK